MSAPETPATPGQASRDPQFAAWMDAQSWPLISGAEVYTCDEMAVAFTAGMQAERDLAARQPQPAPGSAEPNAAFTAWAEANRIDPIGMDYAEYGADALRDAFAAGMDAAQPAPELAAAMAETRQLRIALRTMADLWDASSDKDEETAARPNRARLVLEERATTRRNCAADIRKLAGPEGK